MNRLVSYCRELRSVSARPGSRRLAALASGVAAVVAVSLLTVTGPQAALGASTADSDVDVRGLPTLGAAARAQGKRLIEGRVFAQDPNSDYLCEYGRLVDSAADPSDKPGCKVLDNVKVTARTTSGKVVASALSYASAWPDGTAHGYYFLEVPPGEYVITFHRKRYYDQVLDAFVSRHRERGIRLRAPLYPLDVRTSVKFPSDNRHTFARCEQVKVPFTLEYADRPPRNYPVAPYGTVTVYQGSHKYFSGTVKKSWKGTAQMSFRTLRPGTHHFTFMYNGLDYRGGYPDLLQSEGSFTLKVLRICDARAAAVTGLGAGPAALTLS